MKFRVSWPFGSGEEPQNRFSRWQPSWIFNPKILVIFDLQLFLIYKSPRYFLTSFSSQFVQKCRRSLLKQIVDAAQWT